MQKELRFVGTGGQGIVLMGILGAKASIKRGLFASTLASYGAEVRGGLVSCDLVVSDKPIIFPASDKLDLIFSFTEAGLKKATNLKRESFTLLDSPTPQVGHFPATKLALELGKKELANVVVLGYISKLLELFTPQEFSQVIKEELSEKIWQINERAFQTGYTWKLKDLKGNFKKT